MAIAPAGKASNQVAGDVDLLTFAKYGQVRIVTVADLEERRLSAPGPEG